MDYEKKYKELVEAIKQLQETNPSDEGIQNWANEIFHYILGKSMPITLIGLLEYSEKQ